MLKQEIEPFIGHFVKLVKFGGGYVLHGKIESVSESSIIFNTKNTKSIIDIRAIESIVLKNGC
jgi:hypothetical protein